MEKKWLPDWRDEKAYPPPNSPARRWAWEFLRRSPEYQDDFERLMQVPWIRWRYEVDDSREGWQLTAPEQPENPPSEWFSCDPPSQPGEKLRDWLARVGDGTAYELYPLVAKKYGLSRVPAPDDDNPFRFRDFSFNIEFVLGSQLIGEDLPEHQKAIIFDLSLPIQPQIRRASAYLRNIQREINIEIIRKDSRFSCYQDFLRILDARHSGASYAQIAAVLYPKNSEAIDRVKKNLKSAKRLRDRDYKFLLI